MEHLANTLRALASSKDVNLLAVASALEKHANEGADPAFIAFSVIGFTVVGASGAVQSEEPKTYRDLVNKYHQAQVSKKTCGVRSTGSVMASKYYSVWNHC